MTLVLGPDDIVPRRPFTSFAKYQRDTTILSMMLSDLRSHVASIAAEVTNLSPYHRTSWRVAGLRRRIVLSDADRLHGRDDLYFVGFFADRHPDVEIGPLERVNTGMVKEFRKYPSIISYSSAELPCSNWANLVVNDHPDTAQHWRTSEAHKRAVRELSPVHYRNVRIHLGVLPGGINGPGPLIERTKYYDYRAKTVWSAVRELTPA